MKQEAHGFSRGRMSQLMCVEGFGLFTQSQQGQVMRVQVVSYGVFDKLLSVICGRWVFADYAVNFIYQKLRQSNQYSLGTMIACSHPDSHRCGY